MKDLHLAFISNRMTQRTLHLLSVIERTRLFTIGEMAEKMQVTQRTIANDIKFIKDYFGDCITLLSGYHGFYFRENNPLKYQERKQSLLENECFFKIIKHIFLGNYMRVDELAHQYHFSESTFRRLLAQSSHLLAAYELKWGANPLTIEGSEENLRKFFKDLYYEGNSLSSKLVPDKKLLACFVIRLEEKLSENDIGCITAPASFYYTFYIAIRRASLGFSVTVPIELKELARQKKSFVLLYSLKEEIKELYGIELSEDEFAWIYLVTICERTLDREESEKNFYQYFNQGTEITNLTEKYLKEFELEEKSQPQARSFLRAFFLSRKINHTLSPVLNKEARHLKEAVMCGAKENYQRNFHFLKNNQQEGFLVTPYLEDICASLTIYSNLVFDFCMAAKKIYFLIEGDHHINQQIRARAVQQFGAKHSLTFLTLQSFKQGLLNDQAVDLIVTNYSPHLADYTIETEYLLIKTVPDEQDWLQLEKKVNPYRIPMI